MVVHEENLRVLVDASQSSGVCNLRRKPGVDETKRNNSHCSHQVKNLQTGGVASTRPIKHYGGSVLVSKMATSTSSTATVFVCGMLAGIAGSFILQLHDKSKTDTLCALRGERNLAIEQWTSGRENEDGDSLDMMLLAYQELDGYQNDNNVATEQKIVNSSVQVDLAQRTGTARMLIDDDSVQPGREKTTPLEGDFMRQFREKIDDRPMYEVFSSHPKFKDKFSKEEFFDAHSAVQSLFLKPRKFSPSAFKLFEHYLDRLLLKKEQQASGKVAEERMRDRAMEWQCDSEKMYLDRTGDPWKFSPYDQEYSRMSKILTCPPIVGNPQQNETTCGRPTIDSDWILHYRRYWDQLFRYGPDKDGKIPSSPRSVVNIESVPIWENLAVGDKNSGIGGQKPWLHTKGELNRRRFGFRFLDSTESPPCVARTIDLGLLFLGTGFFDTKQNYHHVLSNAILPMFSALRDAGVISGNKRTQSVVLVYMSTNYYGPQLPTWLLDYLKPLVDEIFVIHHMQYGQCLKIKKAIFGNGAVELGSRGPLWENMYNTGDVVKAIEKIPAEAEFRSFYMNAFGIPERPVDYESSGDILFVNRNENLADPRGTRRLDDIENAIACARLGPLKDRIRVVDWSEYSIIEQLEMTYNAAAIISIHGAALSNTLWMRPGSQIIELIPYKLCGCGYFQGTVFQSMALVNQVDYHGHCLHRGNMIYMEGFEPSEEEESFPCKYNHFPFLYGVDGIRLSTGEIESLLGSRLRKSAIVRKARALISASKSDGN